ncbi:MAG: hypothetical protein H6926_00895 [Chromatiales bacterium]|nr:hypothetical protein [Gammaproteobacteria bacterium]MCP5351736.1 hypothetical protein [Chromatiales bacterium]
MNKKALSTFAVALISTLSGCASGPSYIVEKGWVKQGVSYEQARRQLFDCKEKAKANAERETQIGGLTESCMTLEGYAWGEYKRPIR